MEGLGQIRQRLLVELENKDGNIRADAVKGLGLIGNEKDIEQLISRLLDKYTLVRTESVKGVGLIGGGKVIDVLVKALSDNEENVRRQAVEVLSEIGELAVEPLGEKLISGTNLERRLAAETLGMIGIAQAVEFLRKAKKKEVNWEVRQAIITSRRRLSTFKSLS